MKGGRQLAFSLTALVVGSGCAGTDAPESPAGVCENLLVFDSEPGRASNVFVLNLETRLIVNLTTGSDSETKNWLPDLSPGGAEVVFVSEDSVALGQLYIVNVDGSGLRQLTREPASYESPAWSPDGEWIAFERGSEAEWALYLIRPDGTGLHRVGPPGVNLFHPSWAPDGRRIAVVTGSEAGWIAGILTLESGVLQRVTEPDFDVGYVNWSPDGTTIALDAVEGSNMDLYLLDLESGELDRLTWERAVDARPDWSPNSRRLVFHSTRDRGGSVVGEERWEEFELYLLDLDTGETERLTENGFFDGHPDWCWPAPGDAP